MSRLQRVQELACLVVVTVSTQQAAGQTELFRIAGGEDSRQRIVQVSPSGQILISQEDESDLAFFLTDLANNAEKTLLLTGPRRKTSASFSDNGEYVYLKAREGDRSVISIYDVATGAMTMIEDPTRTIVSLCTSPNTGRIVYQARDIEQKELPQVFLTDPNGKNAKPITRGMGEHWSPDGRWIVLKKPMTEEVSRVELRNKMKSSPGFVIQWRFFIYSSEGQEILMIDGFENPGASQWAPDSRHLIVDVAGGEPGFWVLELVESSGQVRIDVMNHFNSGGKEELHHPVWSPDSKRIAYVRSRLDDGGDSFVKHEMWVEDFEGGNATKISEASGGDDVQISWTIDNSLLVTNQNRDSGVSTVCEFR